jgi:hypothetical protein
MGIGHDRVLADEVVPYEVYPSLPIALDLCIGVVQFQ